MRVIHGCENYTEKFGTSPTKLPCCYFCQGTKVNITMYILLPVSKIGIFRDHVAPPDFAENTDMAEDLDYKTGLDFWGLFFWKNPRLIGGLIR